MENVSFFVTCGRGMHYFVSRELNSLPKIANVDCVDGKVFFDVVMSKNGEWTPRWLEFLFEIKSAERLFVCVYRRETNLRIVSLAADLVVDLKLWNRAFGVWTKIHQLVDESQMPPIAKRTKTDPCCTERVDFRVSCKCAGKMSMIITREHITRILSQELHSQLQWVPDLRNPALEVYVHVNDEFTVAGFPISKIPLSKRPYLKLINLRSTVCWAMAHSADIKRNDFVLDPMCGSGTLLIETLKSWKMNDILGIDISPQQLQQASENCKYANVSHNADLILGNIEELPIRNKMIDVILCDFPFGLKHGDLASVKILLPKALSELNRVCKDGGRIVMLISQQMVDYLFECVNSLFPRRKISSVLLPRKCTNTSLMKRTNNEGSAVILERFWWKNVAKIYVKLGKLDAFICTFHKKLE